MLSTSLYWGVERSTSRENREVDEDALFGALENETSRAILAHTSEEARSVKELAEQIDVSQTSIYRRLEQLTEDGLVHETLQLDQSGNHFKLYRAAITHVSVNLENDDVQTRVDWHEDVSERFTRIWEDIRGDL